MINKAQFKNRKILITGASSGLGQVSAIYFSNLDSKIFLCGRNYQNLKNTIKKLKNPKKHILFYRDLNIKKNILELTNLVIKKKHYDVIMHCMGGGLSMHNTLIKINDLEKLFRVNLSAAVEINRLIISEIIKLKLRCNIIHVGSSASTTAIASVGYNTVKAGLAAYVRSLGRELSETGVIVNGLLPGAFYAPNNSWERLYKKDPIVVKNFIEKYLPRKKLGTYKELMPLIELLSSQDASMMNGCCVPIDGGESLNYDGISF